MMFLQPREITVATLSGEERTYIISKFPATIGREIMAEYTAAAMPGIGDYAKNEAMMFKIMAHVGVNIPGRDMPLPLSTRALVDNHVPDWETLTKIELAVIDYNTSFFVNGRVSTFSAGSGTTALPNATAILTSLLENLWPAAEQRSMN